MSDKLPEWETLDRVFRSEPEAILSGLPDCTASRRAKQLLPTIYDYVKEAREQARREESASEASMRRAKESGVAWLKLSHFQGC
jgi:hypothetical protein